MFIAYSCDRARTRWGVDQYPLQRNRYCYRNPFIARMLLLTDVPRCRSRAARDLVTACGVGHDVLSGAHATSPDSARTVNGPDRLCAAPAECAWYALALRRDGARAAAMGAARYGPPRRGGARAVAAAGRSRALRVRRRARAARAALRQPVAHHGHLPQHTDLPQEPLSPADARWHRQRHHRRRQRLQWVHTHILHIIIILLLR